MLTGSGDGLGIEFARTAFGSEEIFVDPVVCWIQKSRMSNDFEEVGFSSSTVRRKESARLEKAIF